MYLLTNGRIVTEEGILQGYDLLIEDDVIRKIAERGSVRTIGVEKLMLKVRILRQDLLTFILII